MGSDPARHGGVVGIYQALGLTEEELADDVWLDPAYSECLELDCNGDAGIILVDRRRG